MSSENYQLRALFYVGHYAKVCELYTANPSDSERYYYYLRTLLLKHQASEALEKLKENCPSAEFHLLTVLAQYHASQGSTVEPTLQAVREILTDPVKSQNPRVRLLAGDFFASLELLDEALKAVGEPAKQKDVECAHLLIQILIKLNRSDLAQSLLDQVNSWSLDSILVQVMEALVGMASGVDKIQEALWALEELVQTYTASSYLLNLIGVCHLLQTSWMDAGRFFTEAIQADPTYADAQANLAVALAAAGKDNGAQLTQLCVQFPSHPLAASLQKKAVLFDSLASKYAAA